MQILRVALIREAWAGAPGFTRPSDVEGVLRKLATGQRAAGAEPPCVDLTRLPRPTREQLQGSWSVFSMEAALLDDVDLATGGRGGVREGGRVPHAGGLTTYVCSAKAMSTPPCFGTRVPACCCRPACGNVALLHAAPAPGLGSAPRAALCRG